MSILTENPRVEKACWLRRKLEQPAIQTCKGYMAGRVFEFLEQNQLHAVEESIHLCGAKFLDRKGAAGVEIHPRRNFYS